MPSEMVWELRLSVLQTVLSWTATVVASVLLILTSWRLTALACLDIMSVSRKLPVSVRTLIINFPNSALIARKCLPQGTLINGGQLLRVIYADTVPNDVKCQLFVQKIVSQNQISEAFPGFSAYHAYPTHWCWRKAETVSVVSNLPWPCRSLFRFSCSIELLKDLHN